MTTAQAPTRLRSVPAHLIETVGGVILKRGCLEVRIGGERAAEVVEVVLAATGGGATREEVKALFAAPDRPAVDDLIRQLEARRFLVAAGAEGPKFEPSEEGPLDVFYWHFGERADQAAEDLSRRRIAILGVNAISRQLAGSLAALGVERLTIVDHPGLRDGRMLDPDGAPRADPCAGFPTRPRRYESWIEEFETEALDCLVATSDSGGLQSMRRWNALCVDRRLHFLPVVLRDLIGYVGPLIVPGETACYECLRARQDANMADPASQRAAESAEVEGHRVVGFIPPMASILGDIAAVELVKFYGRNLPLWRVGTLIEVNLLATRLESHRVLKLPRCPVCSPLNAHASYSLTRDDLPIALRVEQ